MKLYNMFSLLCCICIPIIMSVFCRCKYYLHIRTLWNKENHESCLYSREEEIIRSLIFFSHHILNIEYIKSRVCLFLSLSIESWYIGCIIFAYLLQQTILPSLFKRFRHLRVYATETVNYACNKISSFLHCLVNYT